MKIADPDLGMDIRVCIQGLYPKLAPATETYTDWQSRVEVSAAGAE